MQKHVNLVDLVKSFPTNIFLQHFASIQKRTSLIKFDHLDEKSEQGSISNLSRLRAHFPRRLHLVVVQKEAQLPRVPRKNPASSAHLVKKRRRAEGRTALATRQAAGRGGRGRRRLRASCRAPREPRYARLRRGACLGAAPVPGHD